MREKLTLINDTPYFIVEDTGSNGVMNHPKLVEAVPSEFLRFNIVVIPVVLIISAFIVGTMKLNTALDISSGKISQATVASWSKKGKEKVNKPKVYQNGRVIQMYTLEKIIKGN